MSSLEALRKLTGDEIVDISALTAGGGKSSDTTGGSGSITNQSDHGQRTQEGTSDKIPTPSLG